MSTDHAADHAPLIASPDSIDAKAGDPAGRDDHRTVSACVSTSPRASDAERADAVARLHTALGVGRLDLAEADERIAAAYAARHRHELAALLADLPRDDTSFTEAPTWTALWALAVWRLRTSVVGATTSRPTGTQQRTTGVLIATALVWVMVCAVAGALVVGA